MTEDQSNITDKQTPKAAISEMQSDIEAIEQNSTLYIEENFRARMEAIDFIEFQIVGQIEWLLPNALNSAALGALKLRAEKAKSTLEEIDNQIFEQLRDNIRRAQYTGQAFKEQIMRYVSFNLNNQAVQDEACYDTLDIFINGLFQINDIPEQLKELEPEMVFYQKTPARIIFELVEKIRFTENDVFYDIGSGLGQVAILVNLLTGITAKGIEYEPAFCDYASNCATALKLSNVSFINTDARQADYSEGSVFFMFTPFRGEMMQKVLEILRKESLERQIKVITYGPCTAQVALEGWLHSEMRMEDNVYRLGVFESLCIFEKLPLLRICNPDTRARDF